MRSMLLMSGTATRAVASSTIRGLPVFGTLAIVTLLSTVSAGRAQEVGEPVFLISPAKLHSGTGAERKLIDLSQIGTRFFVTAIQDEWLWIDNETPGWIQRRHVVPLADAEAHFSQVIRQQPNLWNGYYGRANGRLSFGRMPEAVADLTQALARMPRAHSPMLLTERAEAWLVLGNLKQCIADAHEAIARSDPKVTPARTVGTAHYYRGFAYHLQGDLAKAESDYDAAIATSSKHHAWLPRRGIVRRDLGKLELALEDFNAVLEFDNRAQYARSDRGTTWELLGNWPAAVADFRIVVEQAPNAVFVTRSRESVVYGEGKVAAEDLALLNPKRSAYYNLIMLLAACPDDTIRDGDEAVQHAAKLRELDQGRYYPFIAAEAAAHAEAGDFAKAVDLQKEAIALAPETEHSALEANLAKYREGKPLRLPTPAPPDETPPTAPAN